jgi:hypothetical protein
LILHLYGRLDLKHVQAVASSMDGQVITFLLEFKMRRSLILCKPMGYPLLLAA